MKNNIKNQSKTIQNQSKIDKKRPKIDENATLERFRCQIVPRSAPGRSTPERVLPPLRLFGRKCRSKGPFWDPWKIENRSKIILVSIDGHFDLRKIMSGSEFGKNIKN